MAWNEKSVGFEIFDVTDGSNGFPQGIMIKGTGKYYSVPISEEIDDNSDEDAAKKLVNQFLNEKGIEVSNLNKQRIS